MNGQVKGWLLSPVGFLVGLVFFVSIGFMMAGVNDAGMRTVIQYPSGGTTVKFDPGVYFSWFGKTTEYHDVLTYDFDGDSADGEESSAPAPVRYQDGGTGEIKGTIRVVLPATEPAMMKIHKEFTSENGVMQNLVRKVTNESLNLTAGLMTSEEAYAEKRNQYIEWAEDQISRGKYLTNLVPREQIVEAGVTAADGTVIQEPVVRVQNVPEIRMINGQPGRGESQFTAYELDVSGLQIIDWNFEDKTLAQIQEKREANMAIITSQANAARANQERLQVIAEGERNVAKARFEQEVLKESAVVVAEREAEVARINAARQVQVNEQNYLAQVQDVKAAEQEAEAIELRTTAQADARRKMVEADGALQQKLEAYVAVNEAYAREFAKQKWTPEIVMGGAGEGSGEGNEAANMINLLTTRTAQQLALDLGIK